VFLNFGFPETGHRRYFFMLGYLESLYMSTACLHTKRTRVRSSYLKLAKSDSPVLSAPAAIRGTVGSGEGVLLPSK
jgi:hypothetical protein